jgi:Hemerythrin HHE cation binding domain/Polyketide cyclase / dehydrase and lipid transport
MDGRDVGARRAALAEHKKEDCRMTTDADLPADTRMMRIVHQALRRDLERARAALTSPGLSAAQQTAIARHLSWMMGFLRAHHYSEDDGLYPLVRQRDRGATAILDAMHTDHEAIAAQVADVEKVAASVVSGDTIGPPEPLTRSLDLLADVLLPHLQREEDDMMPVVSAVVSKAEWTALEQQYNLKPKSPAQLGWEGHWLIDAASPEDRQAVLHLVPPVPRFLLLHGFARSYRRRAAACWDQPAQPRRRVQKSGCCEVLVDADAHAVWDVVRDVTRVGEWSHECVGAEWLGDAMAAAPGVRFRGRNRAGIFRWGRVCEIVSAEPYQLVWRTVPTALYPDSSEWMIRLRPVSGGTQIEQTFSVLRAPKLLEVLYATIIPAHRDRTAALTADLHRLGEVAARSTAGSLPDVASA